MGESRRRHKILDRIASRREKARDSADAGTRRSIQHHHTCHDIGVVLLCRFQGRLQMSRIPDVVMSEISDPVATRVFVAVVVGRPLRPIIAVEIVPADATIAKRRDDVGGIVGAAISNNENFEVLEGLQQYRPDRATQRRTPIVSWYHDRDFGFGCVTKHTGSKSVRRRNPKPGRARPVCRSCTSGPAY